MYSDVLAKVIANPEAMARLGKNHQPGKFKAYAYKGGLNVDNTSGAIPKVTFNKYGLQLMFQLTGFDQSAMISAEVSDNSAPHPPLSLPARIFTQWPEVATLKYSVFFLEASHFLFLPYTDLKHNIDGVLLHVVGEAILVVGVRYHEPCHRL